MIGFISSWVTLSLIIELAYRLYKSVTHLHNLQFTVAHALGCSVSTSRFPATDLYTQTILHINHDFYSRIKYSQIDLVYSSAAVIHSELVLSLIHFHSTPFHFTPLLLIWTEKSYHSNDTIKSSPTTNLPRLSPAENSLTAVFENSLRTDSSLSYKPWIWHVEERSFLYCCWCHALRVCDVTAECSSLLCVQAFTVVA
jgi:hypothetical protein